MAPEVVDGKLRSSGTVGFYGCSVADRLVRVAAVRGLKKGPRVINVDRCPACGNEHRRLKPSWRQPSTLDKGRLPEVLIDAEGEVVS